MTIKKMSGRVGAVAAAVAIAVGLMIVGGCDNGGDNPGGTQPPAVRQFTVTFDDTRGGTISPVTVDSGTSMGMRFPVDVTDTCSGFGGWWDGDVQYTGLTVITKNVLLTARWDMEHCGGGGTANQGTFIDPRDGQTYRWVKIGGQVWMAQNLNYNADGSVCYNNQASNCDIYGRMYDWQTVMNLDSTGQIQPRHRGACPEGWHVPTHDEWRILTNFVGASTAGTKLKDKNGWRTGNECSFVIPGTDDYGFSALPGGLSYGNSFNHIGDYCWWWSATKPNSLTSILHIFSCHEDVSTVYVGETHKYYTRCVQNWKTFTVSFNTNGGTPETIPSVTADSGAAFRSLPKSPVKGGHTFAGWFDGEEQYFNTTIVTKNVTLVAAWNKLDDREDGDALVDSRDGQSYRTVIIGGKQWMAENLNYETGSSWCYDNTPFKCAEYGRLYIWDAAMEVCPAGWRLPDKDDWDDLIRVAGDVDFAGRVLKSTGWNGTDDFGFSALPGGQGSNDWFANDGNGGLWWSASEGLSSIRICEVDKGCYRIEGPCFLRIADHDFVTWDCGVNKKYGFSVRCVRNDR